MSINLTLKNIPDQVYQRLKVAAATHHRSLNSEAIACLESTLLPKHATVAERLAKARTLRGALPKKKFKPKDIAALKREGRQETSFLAKIKMKA